MRPPSEVPRGHVPRRRRRPDPLTKAEIVIGRRPGNDIRLDFENISGKHCKLRFLNGLWMVRDLGSTNGTTVNGSLLASEQSVMPDEELGIAGHLFTIDYDPAGPEAFLSSHKDLDEEVVIERPRHSLMDLAGLDTDQTQAKRPEKRPDESSSAFRPTRRNSMTWFPSISRRPETQETTDRRRLLQNH